MAMTRIREKKDSENPRPTLQPRGWGTPRLCTLAETIEVVRSLPARCQQIQTASTRPPANSDFYFPSLHVPIASMVLGENGAAYATDSQTIQAFNVNSGALWSYTSQALDGIAIIASSAGGGLVAQ